MACSCIFWILFFFYFIFFFISKVSFLSLSFSSFRYISSFCCDYLNIKNSFFSLFQSSSPIVFFFFSFLSFFFLSSFYFYFDFSFSFDLSFFGELSFILLFFAVSYFRWLLFLPSTAACSSIYLNNSRSIFWFRVISSCRREIFWSILLPTSSFDSLWEFAILSLL